MKKIMVLFCLLSIALLLASCGTQEDSNVVVSAESGSESVVMKIGFMAPLSGDAAAYGEGIRRGVDLAAFDMGLTNVQIIAEDSKCSGPDAVNAIQKLINVENVQVVIGEVCSGATLPAAPIAAQNKVLMVSASATSHLITNEPYVFRTVPSDALQGDFGAQLAFDKGYRKLAILHSNEDYGVGFSDVLEKQFAVKGGEVVVREGVPKESLDLRTALLKIKEAQPDALYLITNSPDQGVAMIKQAKEIGFEAALIGSEGLKADPIILGAGSAAEGMLFTSVSTGNAEFVAKHQAKYGAAPGPFAAQGYDAYKAIALALKDGARSGEEIRAKLLEQRFEGASGVINFDESGDISGNYEVYAARSGVFVRE